MEADSHGFFGGTVPLPGGPSTLEVLISLPNGKQTLIKAPVTVQGDYFFLVALGDATWNHIDADGPVPERFQDGFFGERNGISYWQPGLFSSEKERIMHLIKLHGSVDWFWLRRNTDQRVRLAKVPYGTDVSNIRHVDGDMEDSIDGRSEILIGTFNKLLEYSRPLYFRLTVHFDRILADHDTMLVAGYGFGDKGINTRIIDWLEDLEDRRLIVLHEDPTGLLRGARGAVRNHWEDWTEAKRVVVAERWLADTSYEEIRRLYLDS